MRITKVLAITAIVLASAVATAQSPPRGNGAKPSDGASQSSSAQKTVKPSIIQSERAAAPAGTDAQGCSLSVAGDGWTGRARWSDGEDKAWTYNFRADGVLVYAYEGTTYDNGRWSQTGATVNFDTNNHFADYTGTLLGGRVTGTMKNVKDNTGEWGMSRPCAQPVG